jgi:GNAT superfamily N-acetyltransferase
VVHVNEVDVIVEHDEPLLTVPDLAESERANRIGRLIARLIDDGSTIQISPGTTPRATLLALENRRDLGVHTQFITNEIMELYAKGVINNRKKGFNDGKLVASTAIGSEYLYEFINDNPAIEFYPSDYVNDPGTIARHRKMVSLNVASVMDLTGQVGADALPQNQFSGVSGMLDFIRGAAQSEGGKSILLLLSTALHGKTSRIVPMLDDTAVVVPRGDVHYVATEYGVVNLFGKSLQERALAMISIAHPDFRESLFNAAKQSGLLGKRRILTECIRGIYPLKYEEILTIDGQEVVIRPAKPVDERRIQEHFYHLDREDVVARFFYEKSSFVREEMEELSQIDYVRNLTMLAVVGEFGFGRVVGVGEYLLDPESDLAEVAFSVSRPWQGKGLGKRLLAKLAEAARENGISGLMAYTSPTNTGMVRLFKTLPYRVEVQLDGEVLVLRCWFNAVRTGGRQNGSLGNQHSGN